MTRTGELVLRISWDFTCKLASTPPHDNTIGSLAWNNQLCAKYISQTRSAPAPAHATRIVPLSTHRRFLALTSEVTFCGVAVPEGADCTMRMLFRCLRAKGARLFSGSLPEVPLAVWRWLQFI